MGRGLFVGLVTLDVVYRVDQPPLSNEKIVASDYTVSAGGPATNAAVTFGHLGHQATILGSVGAHPMTQLIRSDLQPYGVTIVDLTPARMEPPPLSSILVTASTGDRAVVSINAVKAQAAVEAIPAQSLKDVDVVLIDGHQMGVGQAIAGQAKAQGLPVVVDGGSWKPSFDHVLAAADYVICSANFRPPNCHTPADVVAYLVGLGIPYLAITQGAAPLQYWCRGQAGQMDVPAVTTIDTLGAGDVFHGAFCHAILQHSFIEALAIAAQVAAHSCQFFGTRHWLHHALPLSLTNL